MTVVAERRPTLRTGSPFTTVWRCSAVCAGPAKAPAEPAGLPVENRFSVGEQSPLPLALRPQPLDLDAQDLVVLQRQERGDQAFLLRAIHLCGLEQQPLLVGIDVEVHLPTGAATRTAAAARLLPREPAAAGGFRALGRQRGLGNGGYKFLRRG